MSHRSRGLVGSLNGLVAAAHPLAAAAGAAVLRDGGNAFDAAVATVGALNVVEPFMSGLAGMGYAICYSAKEGRVRALDFVPPNPSAVSDIRQPGELANGARPVGSPGSLAGWKALSDTYGTMPFADLLEPAVRHAREGFVLTDFSAAIFEEGAARISSSDEAIHRNWAANYLPEGQARPGAVFRQPALARTYEAIQTEGVDYLYRGPLGLALVDQVRRHGGTLQMADLEAVSPRWSDSASVPYRDFDVHVPPPPCEGFQFLLALRILEGIDPARNPPYGAGYFDLLLRANRLAAGLRISNNLPSTERLKRLLSDEVVHGLRERALDGRPVEGPTEKFVAAASGKSDMHTTSLSVADRDGNAVCITQSLGSVFGSGVILGDFGVCLNNFLMWGDLDPSGTNPLAGGSPLALPLAPSLTLRAGMPVLVLGTPGSYGIPQHQAQVLVQHLDHGIDIQNAVDAPRALATDGRAVLIEDRVSPEVVRELMRCGHDIRVGPAWTRKMGGMQAISIREGPPRTFTGGADSRRDGYVATFG